MSSNGIALRLLMGERAEMQELQRVLEEAVRSNDEALPFWTKLGFQPTGEVKPYRCGTVVSEHVALEKQLPVAHTPQVTPRRSGPC